jgi:hypothetical protein
MLKYLSGQIIIMHSGSDGWKATASPSVKAMKTKKTGKSC